MEKICVAAISMCSGSDRPQNLLAASHLIAEACDQGADWIQLPEVFSYYGPAKELYENSVSLESSFVEGLGELALKHKVVLFAGSIPERSSESKKKVFNTSLVFDRNGKRIGLYRKVHLFRLAADEKYTRESYDESKSYLAGTKTQALNIDGWRVGLSICYDLRFGEHYLKTSEVFGDVDIFTAPSAFTAFTGAAHWHLLLKARAVERQAYFFAANQCGEHRPKRQSYGHALVVDPWGEVLADSGPESGIAIAVCDKKQLTLTRSRLPALNDRVHRFSVT